MENANMKSMIHYGYSPIEESFLDWLDGDESPLTASEYESALAESNTLLPERHCEEFGIPLGSTIGHLVRSLLVLRCPQTGTEYVLSTPIRFPSEGESLAWWRRHRDNPDRVRLTANGDGTWRFDVAD
jgi:hypothetical protein